MIQELINRADRRGYLTFEDVLEILGGAPARRVMLAHVAEAPSELRDPFAVARLTLPLDRQMGRLQKLRAGDECDARSTDDFHGRIHRLESGVRSLRARWKWHRRNVRVAG